MAIYGGPDIITDGLVLHLDAGNTKSYPGSGTAWTDLSSNGNNGTLINGPSYSISNKGNITFDGTNDYVNLGSNYFISTTTPFTINIWFRNNFRSPSGAQSDFHRLLTLRASGTSTLGIAYVNQLSFGYEGFYITNNNGWTRAKTSFYINQNIWGLLTLTYNGTGSTNINNYAMYWNTTPLTFNTSGLTVPGLTTDNNYIGVREASDIQIYRGDISIINIYSKVLSLDEIQQNYNAIKGRYSL